MKLLAIINFIKSEENNRPQNFEISLVYDKTVKLEKRLHGALCSMNKALRKLQHRGIEAGCRHHHIQQILVPNNCIFESDLSNYVRSLELFRFIKSVVRIIFDRFYSNYYCFDSSVGMNIVSICDS